MTLAAPTLNPAQREAARLIARGFAVQPIRPGQKVPTDDGWSTRSASPADFGPDDSICILTGWLSDGGRPGHSLVCVDLDAVSAVGLADQHLPPTPMMDGRPGKLKSHRYCLVPNASIPADYTGAGRASDNYKAADAAGRHPGPSKVTFRHQSRTTASGKNKATVVEMLGSGQQVVCPPSAHPSGEQRTWADPDAAPAVIDFADLLAAVAKLAEACGGRQATKPKRERSPKPDKPTVANFNAPPAAASPPPPARGTLTQPPVDVPVPDRVRMAAKYLQAIHDTDLSRTGQGGHDALFRIARVLVNDFALPEPDARSLLDTYNARLAALNDAWSDAELAKKLADAVAVGPDERYGGKLIDTPPRKWNDGERLAVSYLKAHTVRAVKEAVYQYRDGVYDRLSEETFEKSIRRHCQGAADAEYHRQQAEWDVDAKTLSKRAADLKAKLGTADPAAIELIEADLERTGKDTAKHDRQKGRIGVAPDVSKTLVANVRQAVLSRPDCRLPDATEPFIWLPGYTGPARVANVNNGLLCLDTLTFHPHTPGYFTTAKLPVDFDPAATCPKFDAFLEQAVPDGPIRTVFLEGWGACIDPALVFQHFYLIEGEAGSGKSTAMEVLQQLLGRPSVSLLSLQTLLADQFAPVETRGKLLNYSQDEKFFRSECERILKVMTGEGRMRGRDLYEKGSDWRNTARLFITCNQAPLLSDRTDGVWRRLVRIMWRPALVVGKRDTAMLEDPAYWRGELAGVLNRVLAAYRGFRERGGELTHSDAIAAAVEEHKRASNPAREFLLSTFRHDKNADELETPQQTLFQQFLQWCVTNNEGWSKDKISSRTFAAEVRTAFPGVATRSSRVKGEPHPLKCWVGLNLTIVSEMS